MFSVGDTVVYETQGVCKIDDITSMKAGDAVREYFVLKPVYEKNMTLYIPVDNEDVVKSRMRLVFTKEDVDTIIQSIAEGKSMEWISDDSKRKELCESTFKKGDRKELMRLVGMLYLHQKDMKEQKKHFHISDERYLKEAEKLITEEFAFALGIKREEVHKYISNSLKNFQ